MVAKLGLILVLSGLSTMAIALADPTQPVELANGGQVTMIKDGAQMVLVSQDRKIAVVDGAYVKVGDHIKKGEVVSITDEGVEVLDLKKGKISMLTVTGDLIKIKTFSSFDNGGTKVD